MQSMTGYGQASGSAGESSVNVDIRTVNGRFLDIKIRLPRELASQESMIRKLVQSYLSRGRVDLALALDVSSADRFEVDRPLAARYIEMARGLSDLGTEGTLSAEALLQLPGVLSTSQQQYGGEEFEEKIIEVIRAALEQLQRGRAAEGEKLKQDLTRRSARLRQLLREIQPQSRRITEHYREKLLTRIDRLTEQGKLADEARLSQEILYHAERADISEEMTRLAAHLDRFDQVLNTDGKSIGKNLDFLCQELNREMNTIVSKSSIVEISELAVAGKVEIEKMREQVQNVE